MADLPQPSDAVPTGPVSAWAPLRHPVYRGIFIASLITQVARWMHDTSAAWFMTSLTDSPLPVALMQTALVLPVFLLALPAGVWADLVDRRRWLIGAQLWLVFVAGTLGILTLLEVMTPLVLLLFTFGLGVGTALNMPAMESIIPELVPPDELPGAVALKGLTVNVARALGPALGGVLLAVIGPGQVFLINAAAFASVVLVLFQWRRGHAPSHRQGEGFRSAIRTGMSYARRDADFRAACVRAGTFLVGASAMWSLLPLVARGAEVGPAGYGWLLAAIGTGAVVGVLQLPRWRRHVSVDFLLATAMLATAGVVAVFAFLRFFPLLLVVGFAAGLGWICYAATMNTVVQQVLPGVGAREGPRDLHPGAAGRDGAGRRALGGTGCGHLGADRPAECRHHARPVPPDGPPVAAGPGGRAGWGRLSGQASQELCGMEKSRPSEVVGQREVTVLPRVKKCTPSMPCMLLSPNAESPQPPKL